MAVKKLVRELSNLVGRVDLSTLNAHRIDLANSQFKMLDQIKPKFSLTKPLSMEEVHMKLRDISKKKIAVADALVQSSGERMPKVYDRFYSGASFRYETQQEYNARVLTDLASRKEKSVTTIQNNDIKMRTQQKALVRAQLMKEFPDLDIRGIPDNVFEDALQGKRVNAFPQSVVDRVTAEANARLLKEYPQTVLENPKADLTAPLGTSRFKTNPLMRTYAGEPVSLDTASLSRSLYSGMDGDEFLFNHKTPISMLDPKTGKILPISQNVSELESLVIKTLPEEHLLLADENLRKRLFSVVLDLVEGYHQKSVQEAIEGLTDSLLEAKLKLALGEAYDPGLVRAIKAAVFEYLESQRGYAARTIQLPDERFVQSFNKLISDDMPAFLERVNDANFQKGFIAEKMNHIATRYYKPKLDPVSGTYKPPAVSKIAASLKEINSMNKELSLYYFDKDSGNVGEFMAFNMFFGMVGFEEHPKYKHLFERMKNGLPVFEDPYYQAQRKANELRMRAAPGESLSDIDKKIQDVMYTPVNEIPQELSVLRENATKQFEILEDTFGLSGMSLPAQLTAKHVHNIDLIDNLERLSLTALSYGDAARILTRAEGLDYFQGRLANSLLNMGPEQFSRFLYTQTYGILTIDKSIMSKAFDSEFLAELSDFHGIKILFEDDGSIILKGDMARAGTYVPLPRVKLPTDMTLPDEIRALVSKVEDSIVQASETKPTFGLLDGGGLRVDGHKMAEYLATRGLITAEEAEAFANQIQNTGLLKTSFVGGHSMLKELIGEGKSPGSVLSVWTNALTSLSTHSSTKHVFMRHLFDPSSSVKKVLGEDPEMALKAFKKVNSEHEFAYRLVFLDASGNVQEFVPKTVSDMKLAIDNGLTVTTYSGMVNFAKKLNTFELNKVVKWIDQNVTTFYKAGYFMNLGIALRNILDTPLKALMTKDISVEDLIGHIRDAHKHIQYFSKVIKDTGGLLDKKAIADYLSKATPEEVRMFTIMEMLYHYKITGTPLSSILDITSDKRMYEIAMGLRETAATQMQEAVWNFPPLKYILKAFGNTEEHVRIAMALFRLNKGASMDSIVASSARQFIDYSYKSPGLQVANALIPFVQFALSNAAFWADEATTNPALLRFILDAATETTVDQASREKRELNTLESRTAMMGNFKVGSDVFKWNPSLFDAMLLIPGVLTQPTQRLNPVIRNLERVLSGDISGIELPFELPITRSYRMLTETLPKAINGDSIRLGEIMPSVVSSYNEYKPRGLSRSYTSATGTYQRYIGMTSKMGNRYGGRIARSSIYAKRPRYAQFYNSLYSRSGISRIKMSSAPTTTRNLKYRVAEMKYRFR